LPISADSFAPTRGVIDMSNNDIDPRALIRLKTVLQLVEVGKTKWWSGVKSGEFPQPVRLGPRTTCWRAGDVFDFIDRVSRREP